MADLGEVKRWLIGFGAEAEVQEPQYLRDQIARECREVNARSRSRQRRPSDTHNLISKEGL